MLFLLYRLFRGSLRMYSIEYMGSFKYGSGTLKAALIASSLSLLYSKESFFKQTHTMDTFISAWKSVRYFPTDSTPSVLVYLRFN